LRENRNWSILSLVDSAAGSRSQPHAQEATWTPRHFSSSSS
jgi:hypothetical protein